jgi:hypothetical protein
MTWKVAILSPGVRGVNNTFALDSRAAELRAPLECAAC